MKNFQVWMPVIAASIVVIGNAINAWALEVFRQRTSSAPKAAPAIDRKNRDKAKKKWETVALGLFLISIAWMVFSLVRMLIYHGSDPVTNVWQVFEIAEKIAVILFGLVSILFGRIADRIYMVLVLISDAFGNTLKVLESTTETVREIVEFLKIPDDYKSQNIKNNIPVTTTHPTPAQDAVPPKK